MKTQLDEGGGRILLGDNTVSCVLEFVFKLNLFTYLLTYYLLTYLLTLWSRVLLEKLTVFQLGKKYPAYYRTRSFIAAFTSARHLSSISVGSRLL